MEKNWVQGEWTRKCLWRWKAMQQRVQSLNHLSEHPEEPQGKREKMGHLLGNSLSYSWRDDRWSLPARVMVKSNNVFCKVNLRIWSLESDVLRWIAARLVGWIVARLAMLCWCPWEPVSFWWRQRKSALGLTRGEAGGRNGSREVREGKTNLLIWIF